MDRLLKRRPVHRERLICSFPKSGQTWLRYMLAHLIVDHYGIDLDLDLTSMYWVLPDDERHQSRGWRAFRYADRVPVIAATHRSYVASEHDGCRIAFMVRDPRDVLVSYWLHRSHHMGRFTGTVSEFIRDPTYGVAGLVAYLQAWSPVLMGDTSLVVTYEQMRRDAVTTLRSVVRHFDLPVTQEEVADAVDAGQFSRMREKEMRRGVAGEVYDKSNVDALRVRRGRVHGYTGYLSAADEELIRSHVADTSRSVRDVIARTGYPDP
jgi:hypothetical protein